MRERGRTSSFLRRQEPRSPGAGCPRRSCAGRNPAALLRRARRGLMPSPYKGMRVPPLRTGGRGHCGGGAWACCGSGGTAPLVVLVKIAPRRSCAGRNLAPPVVMLSGAGGEAETSLGERRRTQDARQRESAPPHFHPLTRPDGSPRRSCAGRNLALPVVMLSGAGGEAETSLGERRRTQDARQRESAPPHFHPLTRPDGSPRRSCGGRNLAACLIPSPYKGMRAPPLRAGG